MPSALFYVVALRGLPSAALQPRPIGRVFRGSGQPAPGGIFEFAPARGNHGRKGQDLPASAPAYAGSSAAAFTRPFLPWLPLTSAHENALGMTGSLPTCSAPILRQTSGYEACHGLTPHFLILRRRML